MRVVAGSLGGRVFNSPHSQKSHPMSEKIRGGLFNILGDIDGLSFLDAFAGSGALSYEAASRGAGQIIAIDSDKSAQRAIEANIKSLNLESTIKLIKSGAGAWLSTSKLKFDIVLCDPPYDDVQPALLVKLVAACKPDGLIVLSFPPDYRLPEFNKYELLVKKNYGDAELLFFRNTLLVDEFI